MSSGTPQPAAGIPTVTAHDYSRFWEILSRLIHEGTLTNDERASEIRTQAQANGIATDRDLNKFVNLPFNYPPPAEE